MSVKSRIRDLATGQEWESVSECARGIGADVGQTLISAKSGYRCKGRILAILDAAGNPIPHPVRHARGHGPRPVINLSTNMTYPSVCAAARDIGTLPSHLFTALVSNGRIYGQEIAFVDQLKPPQSTSKPAQPTSKEKSMISKQERLTKVREFKPDTSRNLTMSLRTVVELYKQGIICENFANRRFFDKAGLSFASILRKSRDGWQDSVTELAPVLLVPLLVEKDVRETGQKALIDALEDGRLSLPVVMMADGNGRLSWATTQSEDDLRGLHMSFTVIFPDQFADVAEAKDGGTVHDKVIWGRNSHFLDLVKGLIGEESTEEFFPVSSSTGASRMFPLIKLAYALSVAPTRPNHHKGTFLTLTSSADTVYNLKNMAKEGVGKIVDENILKSLLVAYMSNMRKLKDAYFASDAERSSLAISLVTLEGVIGLRAKKSFWTMVADVKVRTEFLKRYSNFKHLRGCTNGRKGWDGVVAMILDPSDPRTAISKFFDIKVVQ